MAKFNVITSAGTTVTTDTAVAGAGASTTIMNEAGSGALFAVNVAGFDFIFDSPATAPAGTGNSDLLVANATNDLIIWDSALVTNAVFDSADRHRLQYSSDNAAYERFDLGLGNDVFNATYSAAGGAASPGAYSRAVTVWGNGGNDVLASGAGGDRLVGDGASSGATPTPGIDTMFGGAGNDLLFGDHGSIALNETVGANDRLYGGSGADTLYGEGGNDFLQDSVTTVDTTGGGDIFYGGAGDDTLTGQSGSDTLYTGSGADRVYGGIGSDQIFVGTDSVSASDTAIVGFDGGIGIVTIVAEAGSNFTSDRVDGGFEQQFVPDSEFGVQDVLVMDMTPGAARNVLTYTALGSSTVVLANLEAIIATAGADIINMTYVSGGTRLDYDGDLLINANFGNDVVFSGEGADTIIGDNFVAFASFNPGDDLLFGGNGQDIIYGDFTTGPLSGDDVGGNDTLYGGGGDDTIYGGAGDDYIGDSDGIDAYGGLGVDFLDVRFSQNTGAEHFLDGGVEDEADGDDFVFAQGRYDTVHSTLGSGNDVFIGNLANIGGEGGPGQRTDIVFGGTGNDVINTSYGDDTIYGGDGSDVIWGGGSSNAGNFFYGGDETDVIYAGTDGNNFMYGGGGLDYYEWAIYDSGNNDQIYDLHRLGEPDDGTLNGLVVYGRFDLEEQPYEDEPVPDFLYNGLGVLQVSHDLENPTMVDDGENSFPIDPIQLIDNEDGTWTLWSTFTGSNLTFDPNDIAVIALWNNDATNPSMGLPEGTPVLTYYVWDGAHYVYSNSPDGIT